MDGWMDGCVDIGNKQKGKGGRSCLQIDVHLSIHTHIAPFVPLLPSIHGERRKWLQWSSPPLLALCSLLWHTPLQSQAQWSVPCPHTDTRTQTQQHQHSVSVHIHPTVFMQPSLHACVSTHSTQTQHAHARPLLPCPAREW